VNCMNTSGNHVNCAFFQILANTCENLFNAGLKDPFYQLVRTYVLNPKSITMGELYGEVNKLTLEWRDGLMAISVRQAVQVNNSDANILLLMNTVKNDIVLKSSNISFRFASFLIII
jgi:hypothetical protein